MDREALTTSHMRDLMRTHPPTFDGLGSGMEEKMWLLDLGRCFSMHQCSSNTKARCAIMHLHDFCNDMVAHGGTKVAFGDSDNFLGVILGVVSCYIYFRALEAEEGR